MNLTLNKMVVKSIEAFTSKRKLPKNFKDKDLKLFENALTYKYC